MTREAAPQTAETNPTVRLRLASGSVVLPRLRRGGVFAVLIAAVLAVAPAATSDGRRAAADVQLPVTAVESAGFTVSNLDRALEFYTRVLPFERISEIELSGRPYELLTGVFGARSRVARLRLGSELIELTEFLTPKGRPIPDDMKANDRAFQHVAIVVSDLQKAYDLLRARGVAHASTGPQRLPDWNSNAGGIGAFYFRDPDRHFLEIISFPAGKGSPRWQNADGRLFLGIDHTAIVVDATDTSLALYRDRLGLEIAGESENYDVEQEHLNNVFGARLRITALRAREGPGIELLEYLAPRDGRPAPLDLRANDIAHWQTTLLTDRLDATLELARRHHITLVSPGPVSLSGGAVEAGAFKPALGALTRDPDGHGLRFFSR